MWDERESKYELLAPPSFDWSPPEFRVAIRGQQHYNNPLIPEFAMIMVLNGDFNQPQALGVAEVSEPSGSQEVIPNSWMATLDANIIPEIITSF